MPRVYPRKTCKRCGQHRDEVGDMTALGYCRECGTTLYNENVIQLVEHRGPCFDHWRSRVAASVGAVLLDGPDVKP